MSRSSAHACAADALPARCPSPLAKADSGVRKCSSGSFASLPDRSVRAVVTVRRVYCPDASTDTAVYTGSWAPGAPRGVPRASGGVAGAAMEGPEGATGGRAEEGGVEGAVGAPEWGRDRMCVCMACGSDERSPGSISGLGSRSVFPGGDSPGRRPRLASSSRSWASMDARASAREWGGPSGGAAGWADAWGARASRRGVCAPSRGVVEPERMPRTASWRDDDPGAGDMVEGWRDEETPEDVPPSRMILALSKRACGAGRAGSGKGRGERGGDTGRGWGEWRETHPGPVRAPCERAQLSVGSQDALQGRPRARASPCGATWTRDALMLSVTF